MRIQGEDEYDRTKARMSVLCASALRGVRFWSGARGACLRFRANPSSLAGGRGPRGPRALFCNSLPGPAARRAEGPRPPLFQSGYQQNAQHRTLRTDPPLQIGTLKVDIDTSSIDMFQATGSQEIQGERGTHESNTTHICQRLECYT